MVNIQNKSFGERIVDFFKLLIELLAFFFASIFSLKKESDKYLLLLQIFSIRKI